MTSKADPKLASGTVVAAPVAAAAPPKAGEETLSNPISPEASAGFLSHLTYSWMDGVLSTGRKRPLQMSDVGRIGPRWQVEPLTEQLAAAWADELADHKARSAAFAESTAAAAAAPPASDSANSKSSTKAKDSKAPPPPSLSMAIRRAWFWTLAWPGILRFVADMASVSSPFLIKAIVEFLGKSQVAASTGQELPPIANGLAYAFGLFALQFGSTIISNYYFYYVLTQGMAVRSAMVALLYRKSLLISPAARQEFNSGKLINIITTDANRVENFIGFMHNIWSTVIQLIVIIAFLCTQLGPSALVGVALLLMLGPLQGTLFVVLRDIRKKIAPITDSRVKLMQQMLQGIRVLKFFTWEKPFLEQIESIRSKEVALLLKRAYIFAGVITIGITFPVISASLSFVIYGVFNTLQPGVVFASLAWFVQLRGPLLVVPQIFNSIAELKIALQRMGELMLAKELDAQPEMVEDADFALKVENGEFMWDSSPPPAPPAAKTGKKGKKAAKKAAMEAKKSNETTLTRTGSSDSGLAGSNKPKDAGWTLRNINLTIPRGKLVAVVGTVGSGKSSLLNALIGEMKRVSGIVSFSGSLGYAPQQAWIQNASVKDNILFGLPYDEARYLATIRDCALEKDLEILPDGDLTQIGERGINLSGGQKQRINIARLVYFNSQIALLDDPLSAVDAHVGRYLFDNCLQGALAGKTRILVTHQLHFLPRVDYVVVMKDGEVAEQGTYAELMTADGEFATLMRSYGGVDEADENDEEADSDSEEEANAKTAADASNSKRIGEALAKKTGNGTRELMQTEERATGTVKTSVWTAYIKAAGGFSFIIFGLILALSQQGARTGNDIWLVIWTNNQISGFGLAQYISVYMAWGVLQAILTNITSIFFATHGLRAARYLHQAAARRVMRAPTAFFDMTPLGRIINRFSKDQDGIDSGIVESLSFFLNTFLTALSVFALIIYSTPLFVAPLVPVLVIYYIIQMYYRESSRELKRLDSISRSPLYAHIGETSTASPPFVRTTNRRVSSSATRT
ncbi:hypothetical protein BC831DRAFT_45566 [Entophlyctis helioformis]|nr:hypothetical protein BC831DRAFT_45566 [Entophlyctis helioformis]